MVVKTENVADIGRHIALVRVSLNSFVDVAPIIVSVPILIKSCVITDLTDPDQTTIPLFNAIFKLPTQLALKMPQFEPKPLCGYSKEDITYKLEPDIPWVQISAQSHTIEVRAEKKWDAKQSNFKLIATFEQSSTQSRLRVEQSFKIVLKDGISE